MAIAVEPGRGRVVFPLEFIIDRRFPCHIQDCAVAIAHLAVGAVNY